MKMSTLAMIVMVITASACGKIGEELLEASELSQAELDSAALGSGTRSITKTDVPNACAVVRWVCQTKKSGQYKCNLSHPYFTHSPGGCGLGNTPQYVASCNKANNGIKYLDPSAHVGRCYKIR